MRNSIGDRDSFHCRLLKQTTRLPLPVDSYIDLEDSEEEEEESNLEIGCPYCSEGFDALGLCVHLEDQHPLEIKTGVCPLCATNLGRNMISHLIIQHESTLRGLVKRKLHDDESFSIISLLRRKLQEHSRSLQKESTSVASSTNAATDPLLLSFVYNPSQSHEPEVVQLDSSAEPGSSKMLSKDYTLESDIPGCSLTCKDHEEKALKSDFIQTILFSTMFGDDL
ncbi:protein DEHYDRATION-INDUCED 19 homolog 3-like [Cynara cardunculus var. scolymus]|uniref:protein DEHYDRATION-INDUCED 19 homolog 3-like n=1 Tax=Cynara cardunculus var. scolymus TaxID=59895 RepID=UPI000D62856F|nr:protein DEHYDRATION-INDUCED 19 homolog 3-like [Cynara cardunculus var. scolymus]